MSNNGLFGLTTDLLEANLDRRATQHRLIARNLSNIDTPNFRGTGLEFEKQLRAALGDGKGGAAEAAVVRTHPNHLPHGDGKRFDEADSRYVDIGPVHLDIEMAKLAENNIMFNAMIQLLSKKFTRLKTAITEAGK